MVVVCLPAYNEGKIIKKVIEDCKDFCDIILVCDDGSTDDTSLLAKDAGAQIVTHKKNLGKGAALRTLFKMALETDDEIFVTMDADGQFLPNDIPRLVKLVQENKFDMVIGNRYNDSQEMPNYRKIGNKFLDKLTNVATELSFADTQSGFRCYSRKALESIYFESNGFGSDSEILIDASKKNLRITEIPITVIYDTGYDTSTKNPVSHSIDVIQTIIEVITIKHPLKFLGIPGLILTIIGVIFGVMMISYFNETRIFSIPTTLVSLSALVIGLMLLLMATVLNTITTVTKKLEKRF